MPMLVSAEASVGLSVASASLCVCLSVCVCVCDYRPVCLCCNGKTAELSTPILTRACFLCFIFVPSLHVLVLMHCSRLMSNNKI